MASFGRRKIKVNADVIDRSNLISILGKVMPIHEQNSLECQHLYDVYRGKQSVLQRVKDVREEINNKILANHANEIVSFKVSYLLSEPIAYVSRGSSEITDKVGLLNELMFLNNKAARDKEIADDFSICGHAYRMVLPNTVEGEDEPPFCIYTLDPRSTFVVYSTGLGEKPLCAVKYVQKQYDDSPTGKDVIFSIYTPTTYFEVRNKKIILEKAHSLGMIPIFEYVNNNARIGAFEVVETLLDAINTLTSNRVDATEQAVQALMVFINCEITSDDYDQMRKKGAVKIRAVEGINSDIKLLCADFNQGDQQVLMDALYDEVLRITGMPSLSMGSTSDSSNNGAVIVRNGWYNAEARAKDTELLWREAEGNFLKLVLKLCRELGVVDLKLSDITEKFTRRNYEDLQVRSQVLTTMLSNEKIAPRLAFAHCGMFVDSEEAYEESMEWYESHKEPVAPEETVNTDNPDEGDSDDKDSRREAT